MNRAQLIANRLLENDLPPGTPPSTAKDAMDELMPTETFTLKGSSMFHAPGMINLAIREYNLGLPGRGNKKGKKWAVGLVSAWQLPPEIVTKILEDPRTTVEANGDDAVITIHKYDQPPRPNQRSQRPPAQQ